VSSPELNIGLGIMLDELMDSSILDNGGRPESSPDLNIGQWRVLGELTRVEYWTMDNVG
jgi:hypothetical protein